MKYLILFLIGIILYFIVTIEYFNVGGQKLVTPDFPKAEWKHPGPIYYRISDGSCRLGLLAEKYDNIPLIKNILEKTKLNNTRRYAREVVDSSSRYVGPAWNKSVSTDGVYLPRHDTYAAY